MSMTENEAMSAVHAAEQAIASLKSYFSEHFQGARGPLQNHCYGYACGVGDVACVTAAQSMASIRESLMRVKDAHKLSTTP